LGNGFDHDLGCIGSGPAGQRAPVRAAKLGKRVALIERQLMRNDLELPAVLAPVGGLEDFLDAIFNYPTLAERYEIAALDAANKLAL
jgi:flavin-dependent dehydrogenase